MKIVFWFNLALHRIQLGGYKLICPYGSLNSIFLFISTLLHISNIRLDSVCICLAWLPVRERRGANPGLTQLNDLTRVTFFVS